MHETQRDIGSMPAADHTTLARLEGEVARLKQDVRLLTVGHGATFEELAAAGKVGGGTPYSLDELLAIRTMPPNAAPTVPPLVFIHIPKTGGTTLNHVLMKNYRDRVSAYGERFFPRYFPDEFVSLVGPPGFDDTRRPVFFTGHIDIDNEVFVRMPVRYVAITMLRDPVQRVISHYRDRASSIGSRLSAEIRDGAIGIVEFMQRERNFYPLQYEIFAPGSRDVATALDNLERRVSLFGLQDHYDDFLNTLVVLLGLGDVACRSLNRTPDSAPTPSAAEVDALREALRDDTVFYDEARALYARRAARIPTGRGDHHWQLRYAV